MNKLFVVIFFALVLGLLYFLLSAFTDMEEGGDQYLLTATFKNSGGINEGNPIKMAGKLIGQVGAIDFDMEKRGLVMNLWVNAGVRIPDDSELKVAEKGMLGEMYLSFEFGESKTFLKEGAVLSGEPPTNLSDVMGQAGAVLDGAGETIKTAGTELAEMLTHLNDLLEKDSFKENLAQTMATLPLVLGEAEALLRENRPQIQALVENLSSSSNALKGSLESLEGELLILSERQTMTKASQAVESFASVGKALEKVAEDDLEEVMMSLKTMLGKGEVTMSSASEGMESLTALVSSLSGEGETGGTIGRLLNDGQLYENINRFLESGEALLSLLEEQPNSIIFGKRKRKSKPKRSESSGAGIIVSEDKK